MFVVMALMGLLVFWAGLRQLVVQEIPLIAAILTTLMGAVIGAIGFGFFYLRYVKQTFWEAQKKKLEARYPGQPWMLRKDWAARRVVYTELGLVIFLWVWSIAWCGAVSFIARVNHDKIARALAESYWNYLFFIVFVGGGIIGLWLAVGASLRFWRYGRSVLRIETLPAFVGHRFRGTVTTHLPGRMQKPLKAELVCEKLLWVKRGHGKNSETSLQTQELQRVTANVAPAAMLATHTGVSFPVEIDVPSGAPQVSLDDQGNGIRWTLHISTTGELDPVFSCNFEVPIYARR
jgi:hypothetical protein